MARLLGAAIAGAVAYGAWRLVPEIGPLTRELPPDLARTLSVLRYPIAGLALILVPSLLRPPIEWVMRRLDGSTPAPPDQPPEP
ncbi:MAG: hypothetical protein AAF698_03850 [Pseudomonadota bacterium]